MLSNKFQFRFGDGSVKFVRDATSRDCWSVHLTQGDGVNARTESLPSSSAHQPSLVKAMQIYSHWLDESAVGEVD